MTDVDSVSWLRVILAIAIVSGLLGLLAHGLKYIANNQIKIPGLKTGGRRLKIVEHLPVDARRRFIIVRCDDKEHLLLLGINQDIVVDTNLPIPVEASPRAKD